MAETATRHPEERLVSVIETELAPLVKRIDHEGLYPGAAMRALGEAGLFSAHLVAGAARPSIGTAVQRMALVGETCMSTAFCTWCQDAAGWYLEQSENASLRGRTAAGVDGRDDDGRHGPVQPDEDVRRDRAVEAAGAAGAGGL